MGNTLITLPMIAREFLLLTGPGEATAMACLNIDRNDFSLVMLKDGVMVVGGEFSKDVRAISLADFSRVVLAPLAEAWRIRKEAGPHSQSVIDGMVAMAGGTATVRLE